MRIAIFAVFAFAAISTVASKTDKLTVIFEKPHPDVVWLAGQGSKHKMEIKVHGQGEFPPTTKVGLFTYGWLHDSLVYSSNYTDLARKNFTWTFPANAAFTDGQYIVKVFRPRKNWLRKVYGSSMSFRLLGTGIQYRRVSVHKRYVEKIIPFFVAEENGHMIVKVDLSSNFGRSNSKIEFRVFDADSTEEINGLRMKLISKSRNLALYNDKNAEMELEVKSDVITFELPLAFEGSLSRIYIEASTRGLFGRRLIIYRSVAFDKESFEGTQI